MGHKTTTKAVTLASGRVVQLDLSIIGESYGEDADGNRGMYQEYIDEWDCEDELTPQEASEINDLIDKGRI